MSQPPESPRCLHCNKPAAFKCSICLEAYYCGRTCQGADYDRHMRECKPPGAIAVAQFSDDELVKSKRFNVDDPVMMRQLSTSVRQQIGDVPLFAIPRSPKEMNKIVGTHVYATLHGIALLADEGFLGRNRRLFPEHWSKAIEQLNVPTAWKWAKHVNDMRYAVHDFHFDPFGDDRAYPPKPPRMPQMLPAPDPLTARAVRLTPNALITIEPGYRTPNIDANKPEHVPEVGERFMRDWPDGTYKEYQVRQVDVFVDRAGKVHFMGMRISATQNWEELNLRYSSEKKLWTSLTTKDTIDEEAFNW